MWYTFQTSCSDQEQRTGVFVTQFFELILHVASHTTVLAPRSLATKRLMPDGGPISLFTHQQTKVGQDVTEGKISKEYYYANFKTQSVTRRLEVDVSL
jgi:hypothetical protein